MTLGLFLSIDGLDPVLAGLSRLEGGFFTAQQAVIRPLGERYLSCDGGVPLLFTENETNAQRLFGRPNPSPWVKDAIDAYLVHGRRDAVNPAHTGTKVAAHYLLNVGAGESVTLRLRLSPGDSAALSRRPFADFEPVVQARREEADAFYILARGTAEVYLKVPGQIPQLLERLTDGACFGEIGLLQGIPRTATVRVAEAAPAEVLVIDRATFLRYVAEYDLVGDEIAALVRRRTASLHLARALPTLSPAQLAQASPAIETQTYAPAETIIRQGDPAETFYILTQGRAEVTRRYPDGSEVTIDWREPGEYFGEIGLLHDRPRTATVRAAEHGAEVLVLGRAAFLNLMGGSAATESAIAREMARRLLAVAH